MGMLVISSSLCSAIACPSNDAVTHQIEKLANNGTATFEDSTYQLIGKDKTSIYYSEQLLENDAQLNGFLKVTKLFDKNQAEAEAKLIALVPTPNFCVYQVSLGDTKGFIALASTP